MKPRSLLVALPTVFFLTCTPPQPPAVPPEPPSEQGLSANEEAAAAKAIPTILGLDRIAMVITARRQGGDWVYEATSDYDRDGQPTRLRFRRVAGGDGTCSYPREPLQGDLDPGQDPLGRTDPRALSSRAEERAASNGGTKKIDPRRFTKSSR